MPCGSGRETSVRGGAGRAVGRGARRTGGFVWRQRESAGAAQKQNAQLAAEVERLQGRVAELEQDGGLGGLDDGLLQRPPQRPEAPPGGNPLGDVLQGLFGAGAGAGPGVAPEQLGDLLRGLGGAGAAEGSSAPAGLDPTAVARCVDAGTLTDPANPAPGSGDTVATIAEQVARDRQLPLRQPVPPEFLGPAAAAQRLRALVDAGYPQQEADVDGRILATLVAIHAGTDLAVSTARRP